MGGNLYKETLVRGQIMGTLPAKTPAECLAHVRRLIKDVPAGESAFFRFEDNSGAETLTLKDLDQVAPRRERFLLFCDDLTFHGAEDGYIALKVALDGSISTTSDNLLIYATSNRRHLMPEYMAENLETRYIGDEIHPGETVEEKISLSERFGLWVTFYPFDQDEFLEIVGQWLKHFGASLPDKTKEEALQWALQKGSRSGRVAYQFARDWVGRHPPKK